jgi:two-component system phosphate regulon sensor histidine kinase PhoR
VRTRIFLKLFAACAVIIALTAVTLDLSIRKAWRDSLRSEITRNLVEKTRMLAGRVNSDRQHPLGETASQAALAAGARVTIIDAQGKVLADSEDDARAMDNQSHRREFAAALNGEVGMDTRGNHALGVPFLYVAAPISGGAVRIAYPLSDIPAAGPTWRSILLGSAAALLIALLGSAIAAQLIAKRLRRIHIFAERIAAGDLSARIGSGTAGSIAQIGAVLDKAARLLEERFAAVQNSQTELDTLLNSMQDGVVAVGPDNRIHWANNAMERLVPLKARLRQPIIETVRDPDFLAAVQLAIKQGAATTARASTIVPGRTFDITSAPMPGGGAVAVLRDLTETERVEKTRRDFIANVSHELRTPLTSIQGYTETLLDSTADGDHVRDFLEIIRKNALRMSRLTEDLLTLARVESGEHRFDVQPVFPEELLQEAIQSFRDIARSSGVELQVENNASDAVRADREAIHQVFSNLIENALKYGGSGGRVVLGARPSGAGVEFFVRDYGPGVSSEHLPRLFERFYRVDKARSRESGGTGLGLAIAKHIVLAHGGSIRAQSELHHGATFLFTLSAVIPAS